MCCCFNFVPFSGGENFGICEQEAVHAHLGDRHVFLSKLAIFPRRWTAPRRWLTSSIICFNEGSCCLSLFALFLFIIITFFEGRRSKAVWDTLFWGQLRRESSNIYTGQLIHSSIRVSLFKSCRRWTWMKYWGGFNCNQPSRQRTLFCLSKMHNHAN